MTRLSGDLPTLPLLVTELPTGLPACNFLWSQPERPVFTLHRTGNQGSTKSLHNDSSPWGVGRVHKKPHQWVRVVVDARGDELDGSHLVTLYGAQERFS